MSSKIIRIIYPRTIIFILLRAILCPAQSKPPDTEYPLRMKNTGKRWLLIIMPSYRNDDGYALFIIISDQFIAFLKLFIDQNLCDS